MTSFGNMTVTVEMSLEMLKLLGEDWSEPIQIKVRRLPGGGDSRATHEMIARRVDLQKQAKDRQEH